MSLRQIFCRISLAKCREMCVLELRIFVELLAAFLSRVSFSRTCFSTPTSSSSTLCWMPLDVSMNFTSLDWARALPSARVCNGTKETRRGDKEIIIFYGPLINTVIACNVMATPLTHCGNYASPRQIRFVAHQNHRLVLCDVFAPQIIYYLLGHPERVSGHHRVNDHTAMRLVGRQGVLHLHSANRSPQ